MLGLVFLLVAAVLGAAVVRIATHGAASIVEEISAGTCVGWIIATMAAYAAARVAGELSRELMLCVTAALAVAVVAALIVARRVKTRARDLASPSSKPWPLAVLLIVLVPLFFVLFETRMLQQRADGLYSGGTSQYDMAFHIAISTSFLYGRNFPPTYPVLPPEPLLYPPLPDFLTAALVSGGLSFHAALVVTGVTLATVIAVIFYSLAARLIGSMQRRAAPHAAAAIATALFLLNGGYAFVSDTQLRWTNILVDGFLPQRTSLFGIPSALLVFGVFGIVWSRLEERRREAWSEWRLLAAAGLLTAALPLFHAHSYLALCLVSAFLFILQPRPIWVAFWVPAVLPAIGYLATAASHLNRGDNFRLQPGWLATGATSWPLALLENFGLPLLLLIPAWLSAPAGWRRFYLAFVALLGVALVLVFSPNDTDNLKLIVYWFAATSVLIGRWLANLAKRPTGFAVAAALMIASVSPAAVQIVREPTTQARMFTPAEQEVAEFVRHHTRPDALFLTAPTLHHAIVSLGGRATLRGPTSWLWSHGYNFRSREADVRRIYAGASDAAQLLDRYHVDHVYVGEAERQDLRANDEFFAARFPLLYDNAGIRIYDTRSDSRRAGGRDHQPPSPELSQQLRHDPAMWLLEFPRVSYFVYRLYLTTLGKPPRYGECLVDLETLGRGLYVGKPGWESRLQRNKRALVADWLTRHPGGKPVDDLLAAIDERELYRREYDRAYLLMHYFGYLRRNPDDPPDRSMAGFEFWLADLQRTRDYRAISRAFLESTEYKQRALE